MFSFFMAETSDQFRLTGVSSFFARVQVCLSFGKYRYCFSIKFRKPRKLEKGILARLEPSNRQVNGENSLKK